MLAAGSGVCPGATSRRAVAWQYVVRLLHSPWFAYLMLALLQLRVVWGAWKYRDLTLGDTAGYCARAQGWVSGLTVEFAFSPLYTAFYGTVLWLCPDLYWATLLHRLIIAFAASLLALALFRRLLPPGIAWLAAA